MNNLRNIICGICEILDGLVRVVSLGFIHTRFAFSWLVWWERCVVLPREVDKMKRDVQ